MIPFYLITGFLGSGKTTFLKQLLTQQPEGLKIAVVQNEFAPNGIDGVELKNNSDQVKIVEINNGSVFCACLMGNFIATLKKIVDEHKPDLLFLEASGLADPGTIAEIINEEALAQKIYLAGSVCLVDAFNFQKALMKMPRVIQQIRIADWLLLNKIDLVTVSELMEVVKRLKSLNPFANLFQTTFAKVDDFFNAESIQKDKGVLFSTEDAGRPNNIQSVVIRTAKRLPENELENFMKNISQITIRAKGFVNLEEGNTILFQSVFGKYSYSIYENYSANTEFTAIGEQISVRQIKTIFEKHIH